MLAITSFYKCFLRCKETTITVGRRTLVCIWKIICSTYKLLFAVKYFVLKYFSLLLINSGRRFL